MYLQDLPSSAPTRRRKSPPISSSGCALRSTRLPLVATSKLFSVLACGAVLIAFLPRQSQKSSFPAQPLSALHTCLCLVATRTPRPPSQPDRRPPTQLPLALGSNTWVVLPLLLCLPPQIFHRNSSALPLAEKVSFLAKGTWGWRLPGFPSLSAPIPFFQISHLLPAPSLRTLSLKGGKNRKRQRKRTGEAQRGKRDCP